VFAGLAKHGVDHLLGAIREDVATRNLDPRRLPGWITDARIRIGWVNSSVIAVFEDAPIGAGTTRLIGPVGADTVVLLGLPNFRATRASIQIKPGSGTGMVIMVGVGGLEPESGTVVNLTGEIGAFLDCGLAGEHMPCGLLNLFFQLSPDPDKPPVAASYVPFALYLHETDLTNLGGLWAQISDQLMDALGKVHSELGDYYFGRSRPEVFAVAADALLQTWKSAVLVLGSYEQNRKQELLEVGKALKADYDAVLMDQLPQNPSLTLDQNVRFWAQAVRFCVVVDVDPAGHIREYADLVNQQSITALIRPAGTGSTHMIGAESLVDFNFVKLFEVQESPTEVVAEVSKWAESVVKTRRQAYDKYYPWPRP
jgi:hypothetical protein